MTWTGGRTGGIIPALALGAGGGGRTGAEAVGLATGSIEGVGLVVLSGELLVSWAL